jgi:hypothetical protein
LSRITHLSIGIEKWSGSRIAATVERSDCSDCHAGLETARNVKEKGGWGGGISRNSENFGHVMPKFGRSQIIELVKPLSRVTKGFNLNEKKKKNGTTHEIIPFSATTACLLDVPFFWREFFSPIKVQCRA